MMPKFWGGNPEPVGVAGNEQGHVDSHFHNRACTLRAILEYAKVANDDRAAEFVRRGYEYMRTFAIPRLGYVTTWPGTEYAQFCEGCMLGDWVALGIRLSDLGTGDYWDDVDQCVRNHLVEGQLVRRICSKGCLTKVPNDQPDPVGTGRISMSDRRCCRARKPLTRHWTHLGNIWRHVGSHQHPQYLGNAMLYRSRHPRSLLRLGRNGPLSRRQERADQSSFEQSLTLVGH